MNKFFLPLLLALISCNDASFSEDTTVKKAEKDDKVADASKKPDDDESNKSNKDKSFDVPANCTVDGITRANLLTTSVRNNSADYIEYEIFVTDCEGKVKNVQADTLLFDVNASSPPGESSPVLFEVQTKDRKTVTTGVMEVVEGSDLFGVTKPGYRHYRSDKVVDFTVPSASFIFRVKTLAGRLVATQNVLDPVAREADQSIETFLGFGKAAPVTATVLFTNY